MKILNYLKTTWAFIKKHWRWLIPAIILVSYLMVPDKRFVEILGFFAGAIFMAFVWWAYYKFVGITKKENQNE